MNDARSWSEGELLGFDLETTGVDRFGDVPVSFSLVTVRAGQVVATLSALVDPGRPIPAGATAVHGITDDQVRAEGMPLDAAVESIVEALVHARSRGVPVVGMKLDYDLTIVDVQCRRIRGEGLAGSGWDGPAVDGLVLDRHVDRFRKGRRTLEALCAHYQVPIDNAHDARADAIAAVGVARAICERFPEVAMATLADLHADQSRWHREWAESFDAWLQRQGRPCLDPRDFDWPVSPLVAPGGPASPG